MDSIGSMSLPLVALAGAATGVVLCLQTRGEPGALRREIHAAHDYHFLADQGIRADDYRLVMGGRVGAGIGADWVP